MFVGHSTRPPGQLPTEPTGFVGRESELARLVGLLERARLVTVTGPGGVGKTRLALRAAAQAAGRFADGPRLAELSALRDATLLPHAVAIALGLPDRSPATEYGAVLAHLRERNLLLILDTCEHLIDACAAFAEAVIAEAPGVTILATSREPLDVIGENACPVPPLPVPCLAAPGLPGGTAVDLFIQRAAAAVPGFAVTGEDLPHVIRICKRLDGIPLAIELAAVRLRALPLAELADRLDQRPALLASGQRGGRHRTLRDAIGWSYELCTPQEQALWARLSVFAGPVSIAAAEAVCAGPPLDRDQVMATMIRLVDKSVLLLADPAEGAGTGQPTRYRMLDTIREFGAEQLAAAGGQAAVQGRLVARYLAMAQQFLDRFLDADQLDLLRELRSEHANVTAALECAIGSRDGRGGADGIALSTALFAYWRACGRPREGGYWVGRAVGLAPAGSRDRGRALLVRGYLAAMRGDAEVAVADAAEGLRIGTELADDSLIAHGHLVENLALTVAGRLSEAAEAGRLAERCLTAIDARLGLADLAVQLTYLALFSNAAEEALGCVERGVRLLDELGGGHERWLHANLYLLAATALFMTGRDIEAGWAATRSLRIKHEIGDVLGIAFNLEVHGWLAARAGRHRRAGWLLGGADPLWKLAGGRLVASPFLEGLHADAMARSGEALGADRFGALFAEAARRPRDQLVALAVGDLDEPADGPGKARLPGQLTAREHEVATLVAEGLSNRQIAERLFISRRTVDAHVEHIFGKLGISSRVQLAGPLLRDALDRPRARRAAGRGRAGR